MFKTDIFGPLEELRVAAEGDPLHGAVLGGIVAALLEAGRYSALTVEMAQESINGLSKRVDRLQKTLQTAASVLNIRRRASSKPAISDIASAITGGGGSVFLLSSSTNTDIAGRVQVNAGGDGTDANGAIARVAFSTPLTMESPAIILQQDSGANASLRARNVTAWGFDVISGTGLAPEAEATFTYLAVPLATTQVVALGGLALPPQPPPFV